MPDTILIVALSFVILDFSFIPIPSPIAYHLIRKDKQIKNAICSGEY
jgi:hypothetical protein